jgi:hypothetical protein
MKAAKVPCRCCRPCGVPVHRPVGALPRRHPSTTRPECWHKPLRSRWRTDARPFAPPFIVAGFAFLGLRFSTEGVDGTPGESGPAINRLIQSAIRVHRFAATPRPRAGERKSARRDKRRRPPGGPGAWEQGQFSLRTTALKGTDQY